MTGAADQPDGPTPGVQAHWLVGTHSGLLVETPPGRVPIVRAWGPAPVPGDDPAASVAALTPAWTQSGVDPRVDHDLLPRQATGFQGSPAVRGSFGDGTGWAPEATDVTVRIDDDRLLARVDDVDGGLRIHVEVAIDGHDVVTVRAALTNLRGRLDPDPTDPTFPVESAGLGRAYGVAGADDYRLDAMRLTLPVPDVAREVLDFQGRHLRELHPQRHPWHVGRLERVNLRGRTSHEDPPLLVAGEVGFAEEHGRAWAVHLGWSGNHELRAERTADGFAALQAGEHLHPGEVVLAPGQTYVTPVLYGVASTTGLNGVSDSFHGHVRARTNHPDTPRPVTLNTWEAVYFDHDAGRLGDLVDAAADVGIERFVLDDGWFTERDDDTAGLGDWALDRHKHPDGLRALGDAVRDRGMEFGLWVEPEMVNPQSDLFRDDPTVVLGRPDGPEFRHQRVLDVARPDLGAHLRRVLDAAIDDARPSYLKWDCNRDLVAAEHDGSAATHAHVRATWALLDDVRAAHPGLEIESCASGGGRIDLGILGRTDRVWASDTNDPVERQRIQRSLSYLLPPELVGCHVGPAVAHTTARATRLGMRLATAFFGHVGVEWDLATTTAAERDRLRAAIALHAEWRWLLHGGRTVRVDHPDPGALVHAVVDPAAALACHAQLETSAWARPAAVRIPGLEPDAHYRVRRLDLFTDGPATTRGVPPAWYPDGFATVTGAHLAEHGIALHVHDPATATVLLATRTDG